jgi:hypothetical protein
VGADRLGLAINEFFGEREAVERLVPEFRQRSRAARLPMS